VVCGFLGQMRRVRSAAPACGASALDAPNLCVVTPACIAIHWRTRRFGTDEWPSCGERGKMGSPSARSEACGCRGAHARTPRARADSAQPEDWDTEEDGEWEAPSIPNPKCKGAPGCGPWTRPLKPNPAHKGKWSAPLIDNPEYKVCSTLESPKRHAPI